MKYFMHIPKTAGTSLRAAVFGASTTSVHIRQIYSGADVEGILKDKDSLSENTILFGHFSYGLHILLQDERPDYATVLRDPVLRVASLYNHHCRFESSPLHGLLNQRKLTLTDFVESCITPETNNEMVRCLSASYKLLPLWADRFANRWWRLTRGVPTRQIHEKFRLKRALLNVEKTFSHVGCVEDLAPTARLLEGWMGLARGSLSLGHENKFEGSGSKLTAEEYRAITNANDLDIELYEKLKNSLLFSSSNVAAR